MTTQTPRALIVDDSKAIRVIVGRTMKEFGYEVLEAGHGEEALRQLAAGPVAVALVDWNMPVMNGLEFVKAARGDSRNADMRIMMITTESDLHHVQSALEAGADEYVMKPFTKDVLCDKLAMLGLTEPGAGAGGA